jgi:hypothetical protein
MAALSDAVVIGIVLTLVFSAAIYYMFTLFQQLEGKVGVLNNIIFDLKKANEASMMMFDQQMNFVPEPFMASMSSASEEHSHTDPEHIEISKKEYVVRPPTPTPVFESISAGVGVGESAKAEPLHLEEDKEEVVAPLVEANYESMTYKELQAEGKRKHIKGVSKMTKADIIDALKKHDNGTDEPQGMTLSNPFGDFPTLDENTGEFIANFETETIDL